MTSGSHLPRSSASPVRVAIGLGSNLGDRRGHLRRALQGLRALGRPAAVSSLYETAPIGGPDQDPYLNAVVVLETELEPRRLFEQLLRLEREAGRERRRRWAPRTLDLDLLLYGSEELDDPDLTVPHPRMEERRFVLEPLAEVWPEAPLPGGRRPADLLEEVADQEARRVEDPSWAAG